jgi:hypothetical protein
MQTARPLTTAAERFCSFYHPLHKTNQSHLPLIKSHLAGPGSSGKVVDTSGGLGGCCCGALYGLNIGFGGVGKISGIGAPPGAGKPGC